MPTLGTPLAPELLLIGSRWILSRGVNGYARSSGRGLATQAKAGRRFQVLTSPQHGRVQVRLLEDGYPCWLAIEDVVGRSTCCAGWSPQLLDTPTIQQRIPAVLRWVKAAAVQSNTYLWGGTIGPNLDCSGLIQTAFASQGIWLPRDAYQQERFCQPVAVTPHQFQLLRPGDLIFFGSPQRCTHVGLHLGEGRYLHSSGSAHGRGGIGIDGLSPRDSHPVASHYRRELRGAGRVQRCHDGSHLP